MFYAYILLWIQLDSDCYTLLDKLSKVHVMTVWDSREGLISFLGFIVIKVVGNEPIDIISTLLQIQKGVSCHKGLPCGITYKYLLQPQVP